MSPVPPWHSLVERKIFSYVHRAPRYPGAVQQPNGRPVIDPGSFKECNARGRR